MPVATHPIQVGSTTCHIIQASDYDFPLTRLLNFLLDVTEKDLVDFLEANDISEYRGAYNIPYIDTGEYKIIMDTGIDPTPVIEGLASLGVTPEEIDIVIISHFHPDHIGGVLDTTGQVSFPQAQYVVSETEWTNYQVHGGRAGLEELLATRTAVMQDKLTLVNDGDEIVSGITAVNLPGHTVGQMGLIVENEDAKLLFLADSIQTLPQTKNMNWAGVYDVERELASQTRRKILTQAAEENLLTITYHFPYPGLGKFTQIDDGFKWLPSV